MWLTMRWPSLLLVAACALQISLPASAQTKPFVATYSPTANLRNNYSGFVGMKFTVGVNPLTITSLGRIFVSGNSKVHTLKLVNASTSVDVAGGSVQLTLSAGTANTFQYAALSTPIQLPANGSYELLSQETTGADQWYDYGSVTTTSDAAVNSAVYSDIYGNLVSVPNSAGDSYVPVSFLYTAGTGTNPPPTVFLQQGYNSGAIYFVAYVTPASGLGVANVQFQLNGQNYGSPVTIPSGTNVYELPVNLSGLPPGSNSVTAIATDSANQTGISNSYPIAGSGNGQILITNQTLGALRNNYGNAYGHFVGMGFTTASEPLNVFGLGRFAAQGNSQSHLLKIVNAATGADVPGSQVTVSMAGSTAGQYVYGYLPNPVTLLANTLYYVLSQEAIGGDQWYDYAPVTPAAAASIDVENINGPVYQADSGAYVLVNNDPGAAYVPLNIVLQPIPPPYSISINLASTTATYSGITTFYAHAAAAQYQYLSIANVQFLVDGQPSGPPATVLPPNYVFNYTAPIDTTQLSNGAHTLSAVATDVIGDSATAPPQTFNVSNTSSTPNPAFVTAFKPTFLRNNYSGFVGMEFTTGAVPLSISSLGRLCVAGNSGSHTLKLVQASAGTDLAGGTVSISLAGCTAGQFVYTSLANPLLLPAGTSYYLASQESSGGDQWYDYAPVTTTTVAIVNGPVYFSGTNWVTVPSASSSYVPLNFISSATSGGSGVTVTETISGSTVTAVASSSKGAIANVQFKIDGFPIYSGVTSAPYTLTVPKLNYGNHYISAVAQDVVGNSATSSLLEYDVDCTPCINNPGTAFAEVVSFSGTTLRNNYSGWVGMQFTTGPAAQLSQYSTVGVSCVSGNTQPHFVKLVLASSGTDVPGGTAWFNPNCQGASVINIAPLGATMAPSTTYYLVAQETAGGDQWYDVSPAMPVSTPFNPYTSIYADFTIDGPVYWNGLQYVLVPLPNHSYVGVFLGGFVSPV